MSQLLHILFPKEEYLLLGLLGLLGPVLNGINLRYITCSCRLYFKWYQLKIHY